MNTPDPCRYSLMHPKKMMDEQESHSRFHQRMSTFNADSPTTFSIASAEARAILEALKYIDGEGECREVTIFSDSLDVVNTLEANTSKKSTHVIKEIRSIAYHIQQTGSTGINIVWIPGHAEIRGNEQAHDAANTATEKNDIDVQQPITYDEANNLIKRHINQLWQNQWSESEKGGDYRIIEPKTSRNIKLTCRNRKREVTMTRLRFGKSQLNYYMHIMRMHKDGTCDECKIPETIEHFILYEKPTAYR